MKEGRSRFTAMARIGESKQASGRLFPWRQRQSQQPSSEDARVDGIGAGPQHGEDCALEDGVDQTKLAPALGEDEEHT
jgi:hypothetical protein